MLRWRACWRPPRKLPAPDSVSSAPPSAPAAAPDDGPLPPLQQRWLEHLRVERRLAARSGDLVASVQMLIEAAERVPNLQFLVNASKAIFTLLDRKGWNEDMAQRGIRYLQLAQAKDLRNAKVISASELYQQVARKYGIEVVPLGGARGAADAP